MHKDIDIGKFIIQKLKEKERSIAWLARQISHNDSNLGRLLKNNRHIHAELLLRISIALEVDLFAHYSEKIKKITSCSICGPQLNATAKNGKNSMEIM